MSEKKIDKKEVKKEMFDGKEKGCWRKNLIIDVTGRCKWGTDQWTKQFERVSIKCKIYRYPFFSCCPRHMNEIKSRLEDNVCFLTICFPGGVNSLQCKGWSVFLPCTASFLHKSICESQRECCIDYFLIFIGGNPAVYLRITAALIAGGVLT